MCVCVCEEYVPSLHLIIIFMLYCSALWHKTVRSSSLVFRIVCESELTHLCSAILKCNKRDKCAQCRMLNHCTADAHCLPLVRRCTNTAKKSFWRWLADRINGMHWIFYYCYHYYFYCSLQSLVLHFNSNQLLNRNATESVSDPFNEYDTWFWRHFSSIRIAEPSLGWRDIWRFG